jgi:mycofactocin system glycosyltransferase
VTPFPPDTPLVLDRTVRLGRAGRVLFGGDPVRVLRISAAGARALAQLLVSGAGASVATNRLARTLIDGGLAHPAPAAATALGTTVVVPVRDRAQELAACLATAGAQALVIDDGSREPAAIATVCRQYGARLIRHTVPAGPGAARNTALAHTDAAFVAFLDSDCVPGPGWLETLAGHFADPLVAAVAPRVRTVPPPAAGPIARFAAARSPLDMGPHPARVIPGGRVPYIPSAALVVRRAALGEGFDPALRYGEDVDLVWRLHDAGWHVRYEPAASVGHLEPADWRALITRRFRYGTSAAPLAARHPRRLAPLTMNPGSAAAVCLALAGCPRLAVAVATARAARLARRLAGVGVPLRHAMSWSLRDARHNIVAAGRAGVMIVPALLLGATVTRRARGPALALLGGPPLIEWLRLRPRLDPLRWMLLCLADDVAYGSGVWAGCVRTRTLAPLLPVLTRPDR